MLTCGISYEFFSDFTGSTAEKGLDDGINTNINYPLPRGTQDSDHCAALSKAVQDINKFNPGYLLLRFFVLFYVGLTLIAHFISLGVDTFADDPISDFKLSHSCYTQIGRVVADLGKATLFVMEGWVQTSLFFSHSLIQLCIRGYHMETIGKNVRAVLQGFEEQIRTDARP